MENLLVRFLGWRATILHGDATVADRWEWVKRHLQTGPLRTLEAGCGTGAMTLFAARVGNKALGLSFNERNNQVAEKRAAILRLSGAQFQTANLRALDTLNLEREAFDQVLCLETIEHLVEDEKLLKNISSLLKKVAACYSPLRTKATSLLLANPKIQNTEPPLKTAGTCGLDILRKKFANCARKPVWKWFLKN